MTKKENLPSTITVKQVRSGAGRNERVKDTLKALGLGKIGKVSKFEKPNGALLGMIRKVDALLEVKRG